MSDNTALYGKMHIQTRLRINRMIHGVVNPLILRESMAGIIELFGGVKSMIGFIATHSNINKLKSIHQVIKENKIKYQTENNENMIESNSFFEMLPNECIHHIAGYLNRNDIKSFKLSSRQIGIVCLQQMERITIGVLPYNSLLSDNYNCNLYQLNLEDKAYKTRHVATKRFDSLFEEWSKYYHIHPRNQLILSISGENCCYACNPDIATSKISQKSLYLLLDKTNIVILNDKEVRIFDEIPDKIKDLRSNYNLMILEYFDIRKQSLQIVQFILYKDNVSRTRLFWYIEHAFIKNDCMNNEWYNELTHCLKQMCVDQDNSKLIIFNQAICFELFSYDLFSYKTIKIKDDHISRVGDYYNSQFPTSSLYTFQLNPNHPWFKKTNKFQKIMLEYNQRMEKFELEADKFCGNNKIICVELKNDKKMLTACIENYYNLRLSKQEQEIYKSDISNVITMINKEQIKIRINILHCVIVLKQKVSKLFDNIFDTKFIELFNESNGKDVLCNDQCIDVTSIQCYFVLYDTNIKRVISDKYSIYTVHIFDPSRCPYPYYDANNATMMMRIKYSKKFEFIDLAQYIFDLMYKSTDHILYPQYKHLVELFYGNNEIDEDDDDCDLQEITDNYKIKQMNPSITCIFVPRYEREKQLFSLYDSNPNDIAAFDLFLIRNKNLSIKYDRYLPIKFVLQGNDLNKFVLLNAKTNIEDVDNLRCIGLPLNVQINTNDTLQHIIDRHLNVIKEYIQSCWRVKINDKFVKLPRKTWNNYQPWYRFMWNCSNDFIIFKVKIHKKNEIVEPQYDVRKITEIFDNNYNKKKTAQRLFKLCDSAKDEQKANKLMIQHLLRKQQLNEGCVTSLSIEEKEELQRGVQCLDNDHFDPLITMLLPFIPEENDDDDEVELDVDVIDDESQIKMYNYMLKSIKEQETT